ncbi:MAG TPA: MlaD family protein, partial [Chroococcales cyanobacterium]
MQSEPDLRTRHDASLGIFSAVAMVLLLWGYCWMRSYSSFRIPQRFSVIFHEVAGLNDNASVFLDGVRIGIVDQIRWENPHRVRVHLRINHARVEIPVGSKFDILTNGIVGAKFVEVILPEGMDQGAAATPLNEHMEVMGEDPVRPELAVNKLAIGLSNVDMERLQHNFEADRARLVRAADQLSILAKKAMPLADNALPLEHELLGLSQDLRRVTAKVNSFFGGGNGQMSSNMKEVAHTFKDTADTLQSTIHELSTTINDKETRQDLVNAISKLDDSTRHLESSVEMVKSVSDNKDLRSDIKQILGQANEALGRVDKLLRDPQFGKDFKFTLAKTNSAIGHLDLVARQLNQILNKHQPLLHLLIGRPGYLKNADAPEPSTGKDSHEKKQLEDKARQVKEKAKQLKEKVKEAEEKADQSESSGPSGTSAKG